MRGLQPRSASQQVLGGARLQSLAGRRYITTDAAGNIQVHLEDGTTISGKSFGDFSAASGEIVFNTGMTGYNETFTDPSYKGQILVMTYPLIGNYGVPPDGKDKWGLPEYFEANAPQITGLVVSEYCEKYSHWEATRSLGEWLKEHKIPAITGVDTRQLTKHLRENGNMMAKMVPEGTSESDVQFVDIGEMDLVGQVTCDGLTTYNPDGDVHVLAIDCGMKHSILRNLLSRGAKVTVAPASYPFAEELKKDTYDGLFLSNGPGNPEQNVSAIENLRQIINTPNQKPVFGICLGHQLLALAAGGSTYKLPYGHRSQNQPCIDVFSQRCYITSQNHGYAVDDSSLQDWQPYFVNANDHTSEGIAHKSKPFFSVQFHPEAKCGPVDTEFLFDDFLSMARGAEKSFKPLDSVAGAHATAIQLSHAAKKKLAPLGYSLAAGHNLGDHVTLFDKAIPADVEQSSQVPPAAYVPTINLDVAKGKSASLHTSSPNYKRKNKVLILGSGGLQIGQAGEFDYSGSQAIKALKEEGIETVLINPNIATVQTAEGLADAVYFLPVTFEFVKSVIQKERPDGILLQFGGQTALNTGIQLNDSGVLREYNVEVMGTSVKSIICTEDREIFANKLKDIGESIAPSIAASTVTDALAAAEQIGYPVIVRSAFSLGGLGSGFADNKVELRDLVVRAFSASPQVLVEKSIKGWKELEYEVMRDSYDNCITVCNMENFDPLGTHTGDSIVVAPSQTLNDHEYHMLRKAAINTVRHLDIVGECNVQFALSPDSREYCIIECNPRLSRSSALASKATGYPLPFVAAKVAMGHSLPSILNNVNQTTSACFEPALDYCVTKMPRWDLAKFRNVSNKLGSGMKSVGEVMGIGRTFEESFQKALRMVDKGAEGLDFDGISFPNLHESLAVPTDERVWAVATALREGMSVDQIHDITKIDKWFLYKCENIINISKEIKSSGVSSIEELSKDLLYRAKRFGFSDVQIADLAPVEGATHDQVRAARKALGIVPFTKQIDTLAAEFPAPKTNYLYMTYSGEAHDIDFPHAQVRSTNEDDVMILGGGTYRIGSSVEFDYSAVGCIRALREMGKTTTTVNYNPETVSTDYDESDRLFFEELSLERVLDIHDIQRSAGTVVSVGGQIPNNLALPLAERGVDLLGTSAQSIDNAEDRRKFSDLLDSIGVQQPEWSELTDLASAKAFAKKVAYPVLVRPSYVLSGGGMQVVHSDAHMEEYLADAEISTDFPIVVSKFIEGAREIDFDGVADEGKVLCHAVSEHIEQAGVHSGDATLVLPSPYVSAELEASILDVCSRMAEALKISGPFNSQLIVDDQDNIKVIECNVRASRSLPFVSKAIGVDMIRLATEVFLGKKPAPITPNLEDALVCVKSPQFSFTRLLGADPLLGVEMASTGEVACFGDTVEEAFLKSYLAATNKLPKKRVLLSTGSQANKDELLPYVQMLVDMGFELYATPGTAAHLMEHGIEVSTCYFEIGDQGQHPKATSLLANKDLDLVINVPSTDKADVKDEMTNCFIVRRAAVDYSCTLVTNLQIAKTLIRALSQVSQFTTPAYSEVRARLTK